MLLRRVALAAVLVAAMPPAFGASKTAAPGSEAPLVLAGVNTFIVDGPAAVDVEIPMDTVIDAREQDQGEPGPSRGIEIHGRGRFAGIALVRFPLSEKSPLLLAGNLAKCSDGCRGQASYPLLIPFKMHGIRSIRVRAGDYRLFFVTDAGDMRVTMKLGGLRGNLLRRFASPNLSVHLAEPTPTVSTEDVAPAIRSTADHFNLESDGLLFTSLIFEGETWIDGNYGDCLYQGDPPIPDVGAYVSCPSPFAYGGGTDMGGGTTTAGYLNGYAGFYPLPAGEWSYGQWYAIGAPDPRITSLIFHLPFD